jgi:hypothetical protein
VPLGSLIWDDNKTIENKKRQTHFEKYRVENINFNKNLGNVMTWKLIQIKHVWCWKQENPPLKQMKELRDYTKKNHLILSVIE